eukprot:gene10940-17054_t
MQERQNTTSIAVPPLTRAVLHPVLKSLTDSNRLDFTQLTDRMYLQPIVSGGVQELGSAIDTGRSFSFSSNNANRIYMASPGSSPGEIVYTVQIAGTLMAFQQMNAILGTEINSGGSSSDGFQYMGKTRFSDAQAREYMTLFAETARLILEDFPVSAGTLEECEAACEKIAVDFHDRTSSLLKGAPIRALYFIGMRPWVRAVYVGMFCKDDRMFNSTTGKPIVRSDSSVYDSRTAEMLLMTAATQIIFIVLNQIDNQAGDANGLGSMSPLLMKAFMNTIVHFYARQDVTTGDRAIMDMYKKVVKIAKTNEQLREDVLQGSNELMVRKEDAVTMHHNMERSKKRTRASESSYRFWVITLLVYIISSIIVSVRGSRMEVYWLNGVVLFLLATAMAIKN